MVFSARDPHYRLAATRQVLKAYAVAVAIESLIYLFCIRQLVLPRIFASYSPRAAISKAIPFALFLKEVYTLASGVIDGALPPQERVKRVRSEGVATSAGGLGLVGLEEQDFDSKRPLGEGEGGGAGVEVRVLSSSSSIDRGVTTPTRRR